MLSAEPLPLLQNITFESYSPSYRSLVLGIPHTKNRTIFSCEGDCRPLHHSKDPYFQWIQENFCKIADPLGRPWLITNGDYFSNISWKPSESEMRVIKNQGLNVFHYEPVFIYNSNGHWPWISNQSQPRFLEIEFVAQFAREHQIKDVTIHVCEQGLSQILKKIPEFSHLRFRDWSTYLIEIAGYEKSIAIVEHTLERRFICTNFRYDPFREMLVGFLIGRGYHEDSYLSYYHLHNKNEFLKRLPFLPETLAQWPDIEKGISQMQHQLPFVLEALHGKAVDPQEQSIPDLYGTHNMRDFEKLRIEFLARSLINLYCESRPLSPRSEISEKTVIPISMKKPFLPFAAPYFLQSLRELGFKTFGDFWDESFDRIEDPARRFEAYLRAVESLTRPTYNETYEMYEAMEPILEHNSRWLREKLVLKQKLALWEGARFISD